VITNLPYTDQDRLGAHLIALGARDGCSVALPTRAEWIVAGKRRALVHEHRFFAGVVFSDIATALVRGQHCLAATQFHLGRMVNGAAERDAAMGSIRRWGPCIPRRSRHSSASAGAPIGLNVAAEVEMLDALVFDQICRGAGERYRAGGQRVGAMGDAKRHARILLHQQHAHLLISVDGDN
jgi:hypothetical protein